MEGKVDGSVRLVPGNYTKFDGYLPEQRQH